MAAGVLAAIAEVAFGVHVKPVEARRQAFDVAVNADVSRRGVLLLKTNKNKNNLMEFLGITCDKKGNN